MNLFTKTIAHKKIMTIFKMFFFPFDLERRKFCENLVDLEKIMLENAHLGAKIGYDTAEKA